MAVPQEILAGLAPIAAGNTFVQIGVLLAFFQGPFKIWAIIVPTIYAGSAVAPALPAAFIFVRFVLTVVRVVPVLDFLISVFYIVFMNEFV
jgi:hypothetical protein